MAVWNIDISIEPGGRDVAMQVAAQTSKEAAKVALDRLAIDDDELIHVIHISRPVHVRPGYSRRMTWRTTVHRSGEKHSGGNTAT